MAGLLSSESFFKKVTTTGDLDDMGTGFNTMDIDFDNVPPVQDSGTIGNILTFSSSNGYYRSQLAFTFIDNSIWIRTKAGSLVNPWKKIG